MITAEHDATYIHNPTGKGWIKGNYDHRGRFKKLPKKTDYDGAIIGCLVSIVLVLMALLAYLLWAINVAQYPR